MSSNDVVRLEISNDIATVTLDRPPVNAVDRTVLVAIRDCFRSLNDRRDVRAAIFTASGNRAFMGGADLGSVGDRVEERPPTEMTDRGSLARDAMWSITDCAVPVIGAINGPAVGGGLAFAACCDILVAVESAWFATLEINVGLLGAGSHLLQLVGRHTAREMFFLGERIPAHELKQQGVIRDVVPETELLDAARTIAAQVASKSPIAMRLAKESLNRIDLQQLKDSYRLEQDYTHRLMQFDDSAEARSAYLDKRDPVWRWR